ncbi:MAG: UPF0182 family protein [bacterium]
MRPPMPAVNLSRRARIAVAVVAILIVLLILALSLVNVYTSWLWFGELGFRGVYSSILRTRILLFLGLGLLMAAILGANVALAYRLRPPFRPMSPEQQNLERYRIALEPRRRLAFIALLVIALLSAGSSAQRNWKLWMLWFNGGSFGIKDPQFGKDISFFAFDYPMYRLLLGFGYAAVIFSILLSAAVYYLYGALRLQTPGPKITISARRHLTVLVFIFIVLKAISYWLDRYGLVFSGRGKVTGASYTDVNASLPAKTILFWLAIVIAIGVLASIWLSSPQLPAIGFGVLVILSIVISGIYPALVQQISVKPNASVKERPYISRNIAATRRAYGIVTNTDGGTVAYKDYAGKPSITTEQLTTGTAFSATRDNIRVLDPNVVSPTFTQLQQLRNVYGFSTKLDIDRYKTAADTKDYVVGVRDLRPSNFDAQQSNWINQHSLYTHGYGFVAAAADEPVDRADQFAQRNIPPTGFLDISRPEIYYGELGVDYSIVGAKGTPSEYNGGSLPNTTYAGKGGVKLGNVFTRAAFAVKYGQANFLLNKTVSAPGARIIFDRDPRQRVLKVAPYLKVDGDPYPSVIDGHIVWILDGYTTMANFPYSEKEQLADITDDSLSRSNRTAKQPDSTFNYIRNSVKATVDAYDGTVHLYQWDDQDPLLKAWMKAFPNTVEPKSAIPAGVLEHVRYPQDLFEVQRELLARYHVTDPVQFYNASDQWTVPSDPYASGDQPPYYLLAGDPTDASRAQYQLTTPMRVNSKDNLAAYISVNSENGPNYGKMTVLRVPTGSQTFGPAQVANQFKSDTVINQQVNLFDQGGSTVIYGNLLTLPVGEGFLYVTPLYVQGQGASSQPLLRRVIVNYGDKIGYDETLGGALKNLTQPIVGEGINDTTNPSTGPAPSVPSAPTPSTSSSPTGGAPTSAPGPGSTGSPQIDTVLRQLDAAAARLSAAYKAGDPQEIGAAQAELKRLSEQYLKLRAPSATKTR